MATEIIKDGDILEQNLIQNKLSREWLIQELKKRNINDLTEVIDAALNTDGSLYIDQKTDGLDYVQETEDPKPKH